VEGKLTSYLIKHDRKPLRFPFVFYKSKAKELIWSCLCDDSFEDEWKESGKVSLLKRNKE
jgi:hypothetical protein